MFFACVLIIGSCLIQSSLHFLGIVELRELLGVSHTVMVSSTLILAVCIVHDTFHSSQAAPKGVSLLLILGILLDTAMVYIGGVSSSQVFSLISFILYVSLSAAFDIREYQKNAIIKRQEQEALITEHRIAVMLSQIQPHFLYNSLTAIAQLCSKDATLAKQATIVFADYLRGNMESLHKSKRIPFQQELGHIEMYIFLEKLRFENQLQIEYNIQSTDFLIPPLTVQPLVENAVKHGIGQKEAGGTITIKTQEDETHYRIVIQDDGIGFDSRNQKSDGRKHIGLANARDRLQILCAGSLVVESTPGIGTTSTISIPKGGCSS